MRFRDFAAAYSPRPGYWFVPKRFGWGAMPVTWQGWTATFVFVALAAVVGNLAEHRSAVWAALLVPLVLAFLWLCWVKTDGDWSWRWGEKK